VKVLCTAQARSRTRTRDGRADLDPSLQRTGTAHPVCPSSNATRRNTDVNPKVVEN
jgi:organic hydroperoxide reductase OsmC/OhrA